MWWRQGRPCFCSVFSHSTCPQPAPPISIGQLSVNQSFVGKSSRGQHNRSYLTIFALIFGGVCMLRCSHDPTPPGCNLWNIVSYFIVKIFNIVTVVRGQGVETKKEIWLTMASIKKKWKNVPMSLLHHKARWGHVSPGCGVWRVTLPRPGQWQYRSGASHYLTRTNIHLWLYLTLTQISSGNGGHCISTLVCICKVSGGRA